MSHRFIVGVLLIGIFLASGVPTGLTASYGLDVAGGVDTPSREITIRGTSHTVSAVATTPPGSTLSVSATAPSGEAYRVYLYNSNQPRPQVEQQHRATGTSTVTFDLGGYDPGSYMLALVKDGDYKAVYPVVVRGYTVSVEAAERATPDSELSVTVTPEKTGSVEDPHAVKVVLANSEQTVRSTATKVDSGAYQATVSLDKFQTGNIRIYAVVQGSDDGFKEGRKELLGISDTSTLTITQDTTQTSTTTDSSAPTQTTTATTTPLSTTATATTSRMTTVTSPSSSTTSSETTSTHSTSMTTTQRTSLHPSPTSHSMSMTTTQRTSLRPSPTSTTDASVITPIQSTTAATTTSDSTIPGFGFSSGLVALCCLLILAFRKR